MLGPELFVIHTPDMNRVLGNGTDAFVLAWIDFRVNSEKNGEVYKRDGVYWWRLTTEALAEECGFSYGVTRKSVERLLRDGFLEATSHQVRGVTDRAKSYRLTDKSRLRDGGPVQLNESGPAQLNSSSSSLKKEVNTVRKSEADEDFNAWWKLYPKKQNKGAARKAYQSALGKASAEDLMLGLKAYLELSESYRKGFVPLPTSWLNGERWCDEYEGSSTARLDEAIAARDVEAVYQLSGLRFREPEELVVLPLSERSVARREAFDEWVAVNREKLVAGWRSKASG